MIYILYHYALSVLTPLYCGDSRHRHPLNPLNLLNLLNPGRSAALNQ